MSVFFLLFCPLKNAYKLSFPLHLRAQTEGQRPSEAIRGTRFSHPNLTRDTLYGLSPRKYTLNPVFSRGTEPVQWKNSWEFSQSHIYILLCPFSWGQSVRERNPPPEAESPELPQLRARGSASSCGTHKHQRLKNNTVPNPCNTYWRGH